MIESLYVYQWRHELTSQNMTFIIKNKNVGGNDSTMNKSLNQSLQDRGKPIAVIKNK